MVHTAVRPAKGIGHVSGGVQRGCDVLLPPGGEGVQVGLCHPRFAEAWVHFDREANRDVPHFEPEEFCPYCGDKRYGTQRCYLHLGVRMARTGHKLWLLKLTDTAFEHSPEVKQLHNIGELHGHTCRVFRRSKHKNSAACIELLPIARAAWDPHQAWDLQLKIDHLYLFSLHQKIAERYAAAMR